MSRARHYRYHPSTVETTSWTIQCGRTNHRIHLVRGKLVLSHHTKHEMHRAILRHHLGEQLRPCMAVFMAFKASNVNLTSQQIPENVREAICIARYARRTVDHPASVPNGLSPTTVSDFFSPISQLLQQAGLLQLSSSFEFRVPSLHLVGFTYPILVKQHGRWEMPDDVIRPLRRAVMSDHSYTELLTAIHRWITTHNPC